MHVIGAALRNNVDDAARRAAIFRIVVAKDHLELLQLLPVKPWSGVHGSVNGVSPSTLTMLPLPRAPLMLRLLFGAGPIVGEMSRATWEFIKGEIHVTAPIDRKIIDLSVG